MTHKFVTGELEGSDTEQVLTKMVIAQAGRETRQSLASQPTKVWQFIVI